MSWWWLSPCCAGENAETGTVQVVTDVKAKPSPSEVLVTPRDGKRKSVKKSVIMTGGVTTQEFDIEDDDDDDFNAEDPGEFSMEVHCASLTRNFRSLGGVMNPYVVVSAGGAKVFKTAPDQNGGKSPVWNMCHSFGSGTPVPEEITVTVWDTYLHMSTLCGTVTIPCDADMGHVRSAEFELTKREKPTGVIRLSMNAGQNSDSGAKPKLSKLGSLVGGEFDTLIASFYAEEDAGPSKGNRRISMKATPSDFADGGQDSCEGQEVEADAGAAVAAQGFAKKRTLSADLTCTETGMATPILGSWTCTATHGFEEFLKSVGVGMFQRKIALAAKWPSWEFGSEDNQIIFLNHSAIGDLTETFPLDEDYDWKDGHKNPFKCHATWTPTGDGGTLKITRSGELASYFEERTVTKDTLEFLLTHETAGVSWGRTFKRDADA